MHEIAFRAMNCGMRVLLDAPRDASSAAEMTHAVPAWFAEWEQRFSRFRTESELNRLNSVASSGAAVAVSDELFAVVQRALDMASLTDGLVSPLVLPAVEAAGYVRSFEQMAQAGAVRRVAAVVADWRAVVLDLKARTVALPRGASLDLGGVAKGWCAAAAARRLSTWGDAALVDAGGDMALSGVRPSGEAWPIAIAHPQQPGVEVDLLMLFDGAVATSGRDYRRWQVDGAWQHHIIDPRTGQPAVSDVLSATVVAPDAVLAEAAAKAVLILGSDAGLAWLDARPQLAGLVVMEDGRVRRGARLHEVVWS